MKMIEAISSFFQANVLWVSACVFVVTVVIIAHGIFTRCKGVEKEEFIDAEYLMEDNDFFVPRKDV